MDKRIGAQLYTVRDFTQNLKDFDKSMERLAAIGYKAVQLSAIGPFNAAEIKAVCEKYQMIPVCTHRPLTEFSEHTEESVAFHREIGCKIAGLGAFTRLFENTEYTKDEIMDFIKEMNRINQVFQENGMSFGYHNHHREFMKLDGKYIMDYLIEEGEFDFIVDVYWLAYAGIDPARFIERLGSRAKVIHFKDLKIVRPGADGQEHEMAEVMEGNLDWDSIIDAAEKAGSEWAVVEQDVCQRNPFACLQTSYENLKTKGFY